MSEQEFRATLNPVDIVRNRATVGGPQPAEMQRLLALSKKNISEQGQWIQARRGTIDKAMAKLDADFGKLLKN
jgi:argininosuccinate lyase